MYQMKIVKVVASLAFLSLIISDKTRGAILPSASFRFVVTSLEDEKFMVSGGQSC